MTSNALACQSTPRRYRLLAIIMLVLLAVPSYADAEQTPRVDSALGDSDIRDAVAALEGYNQALVEQNYSKLRDQFLHVPFVIVDNAPRVITSVEAVVSGLRMTRESLDVADYATTKIGPPRVSVLGRDRLLLNCRVSHLKKDGSVLSERANFYMMVRAAGVWKISGVIPQDPAFLDR